MRVLTVNAGSSSLKLSLIDGDDSTLASCELDAPRAEIDSSALAEALAAGLGDADAVGHRVVHGGDIFRGPALIDADVEHKLSDLSSLAPLHQPKSLAALDAISRLLPSLPAVACFDTAFHATLPAEAFTYALPTAWRDRWPVRRFGFHGLSHAWVARRAPELLARPSAAPRIVSCHLGAGASLCAIREGESVDTTMGFTPLEGLVMATRSGSVDPGLLTWLLETGELTTAQLANSLEHESGLEGLAGTPDMREVLEREARGDESATMALGVYIHRLRAAIAAMVAALGGLDALVFTGGVGERAVEVRARAAAGLGFLGIELDDAANGEEARGDHDVGAAGARVGALVIASREDLEIARGVREVLADRR